MRQDVTSWVGMVVFLAAWAMTFAALFFVYGAMRVRAPMWPPTGVALLPLGLPGLNTLVVLASSAVLHGAVVRVREGRPIRLPLWIGAVMALGLVFLGMQGIVWRSMAAAGLRPQTGGYGAVFWALTVFHALHVVAGIGVLAWILARAVRGSVTTAKHAALRLAAMFWHFVGTVWVLLYVLVYVA
jgi:heme/copper-type cytochrome/quinol oxidase subunit 3